MKKIFQIAIYIMLLVLVFACNKHKESDYHSVREKIEDKSKNYHGTSISSEKYIEDLDLMEVTEGEHTFLIPKRKEQLTMYACTECHSKPLEELKSKGVNLPKSHWDIELNHGDANTMNCLTCHNGNNNMDELHSLTGNTIDFNQSYQLCSQCHTSQFKDWKGGAHGKNISGWAPPRAINTCVNCHNPHQPKFDKRLPAVFNVHKAIQNK